MTNCQQHHRHRQYRVTDCAIEKRGNTFLVSLNLSFLLRIPSIILCSQNLATSTRSGNVFGRRIMGNWWVVVHLSYIMVSDLDRIMATSGLKSEVNNSRSWIVMEWVWRRFSPAYLGRIWGGKILYNYIKSTDSHLGMSMTVWEVWEAADATVSGTICGKSGVDMFPQSTPLGDVSECM